VIIGQAVLRREVGKAQCGFGTGRWGRVTPLGVGKRCQAGQKEPEGECKLISMSFH
jgi:hypothetical protein